MFGFMIVTKREILLYREAIDSLKAEVESLKKQISHERDRAEGAINLVLVKTTGMGISPSRPTDQEIDKIMEDTMDIFGDRPISTEEEKKIMEKLQS